MANTDPVATRTPRAPRVRIQVTQEAIDDSVERSSSHCMIAEAVKHSYPDAQRISVDLQTIRFSDPRTGLRYTYLTPRVGQVALVQFDQGIKPAPFGFQLRNGQVTRMGSGGNRTRAQEQASGSRRLNPTVNSDQPQPVPDVLGGKTPPKSALGARRSFGLRDLEI